MCTLFWGFSLSSFFMYIFMYAQVNLFYLLFLWKHHKFSTNLSVEEISRWEFGNEEQSKWYPIILSPLSFLVMLVSFFSIMMPLQMYQTMQVGDGRKNHKYHHENSLQNKSSIFAYWFYFLPTIYSLYWNFLFVLLGSFPLHLAAFNGHYEIAQTLISRGPSRAQVNEAVSFYYS